MVPRLKTCRLLLGVGRWSCPRFGRSCPVLEDSVAVLFLKGDGVFGKRLPRAIRLQKVPYENQVGTAFYEMKSFMGITAVLGFTGVVVLEV